MACLLSLERIFALDFEDGTLDLLVTSPIPLEGVVISKAIVHWLTTGLPLVLLTPFLGVLLGLQNSNVFFNYITDVRNTCIKYNRNIWCRFNCWNETGRAFVVNFGFASYIPTLIFGAEAARRG